MLVFVINKKGEIGRPKLVKRTNVLTTRRQYVKLELSNVCLTLHEILSVKVKYCL